MVNVVRDFIYPDVFQESPSDGIFKMQSPWNCWRFSQRFSTSSTSYTPGWSVFACEWPCFAVFGRDGMIYVYFYSGLGTVQYFSDDSGYKLKAQRGQRLRFLHVLHESAQVS